jgi:DNA-binding NarL/FixJ family response regulator
MGSERDIPRPAMIRLLLVDDQAVVRQGLRAIMESHDDIEVAGEATDGREAIAQVQELDPDVIMMDIRMPVLDGINATRRLVDAGVRARILILTTYGLDENVYEALMAGATGFILKTETPARLVEAVRAVSGGDTLLGPETTRQLITRYLATSPPPGRVPAVVDTLTAREHEVMLDVARGLSNQEIADHLYIGAGTVKTHVARILAKLGLRDRVQVVTYAFQHGLHVQQNQGHHTLGKRDTGP